MQMPEEEFKLSQFLKETELPLTVTIMRGKDVKRFEEHSSVIRWHSHTFSEMILIKEGTVLHHCSEQCEKLSCGNFLLIYPGMKHYYTTASDNLVCYNIIYDDSIYLPSLMNIPSDFLCLMYPDDPERKMAYAGILGTVPRRNIGKICALLDLARQESNSGKCYHRTIISSIFSAVVLFLARYSLFQSTGQHQVWSLNKVVGLMKTAYSNRDLSVEQLAAVAGVCPRTLLRRFRATFNISPMEYLQKLRVSIAVNYLRNTTLTNEAIAEQCGFCSSSHLYSAFRKFFNCKPSDIRNGIGPDQI